jgi:membrane associated rhomboid family serine protease
MLSLFFAPRPVRVVLSLPAMPLPPPPPLRLTGSQPAVFAPPAILALIALMLGLHAWRALWIGLYEPADVALLKPTAFVAARFSLWAGLADLPDVIRDVQAAEPALRPLKRLLLQTFVIEGGTAPWSLVAYAFLHAGWEHAIFNSLWLLVFGTPVLRRFGFGRFALLFGLTAAAAALFHALINPRDVSVLIGASGAVSGLTAAALRFAFFAPDFGRGGLRDPAPPLLEAVRDRRVIVFIAVWFGLNLLAGLGIPVSGSSEVRIAWEAHVGGFLAGLALFPLLDPLRRN